MSVLLVGCVALVNAIPDSWAEESAPTTVTPARLGAFPKFISMTFGAAVSAIEKIDPSITIGYVEAINGGAAYDSMIVIDQAPPVGALTVGVLKVCLMVVEQGSQTKDRYYDFSDDCPKSQGDVLAEAARAWVPNGFAPFEDPMMSGFAFEANFGVGGHWKHEDCIRDGVDGRCAYGRLAIKNGCPAGVVLGVEWVVHNRFFVDYTRFTTSERVEKGGILEYVAFLPRSSWEKPMSAIPWAELVEAQCN